MLNCCTQYASKFGQLSSGYRTGKGQFYSNPKERQSQRMLKLPNSCTHLMQARTSMVASQRLKRLPAVRDLGSIPGSGRSTGEGNGNPLQYSCLENPMDGGAWWATVHGVAKSRTRLSDFTFTFMQAK